MRGGCASMAVSTPVLSHHGGCGLHGSKVCEFSKCMQHSGTVCGMPVCHFHDSSNTGGSSSLCTGAAWQLRSGGRLVQVGALFKDDLCAVGPHRALLRRVRPGLFTGYAYIHWVCVYSLGMRKACGGAQGGAPPAC
jgi:hypothetical protein